MEKCIGVIFTNFGSMHGNLSSAPSCMHHNRPGFHDLIRVLSGKRVGLCNMHGFTAESISDDYGPIRVDIRTHQYTDER